MWHLFARIPTRGSGYGDDVYDSTLSGSSNFPRHPPRRRLSRGILAGVACADEQNKPDPDSVGGKAMPPENARVTADDVETVGTMSYKRQHCVSASFPPLPQ